MPLSLDQKLNITNTFTQVCLLLLAGIGYFYTVTPLYGKAVLEEQVAKIQLDIDDKNKQILIKEQELKKNQTKIDVIGEILKQQQIENTNLKIKTQLAETRLETTIRNSLEMKKIFCFNILDSIGGVYDVKEIKLSKLKKEEILKSKEKIFKCLEEEISTLNTDEQIKEKILAAFKQNKDANSKLFDDNFNEYLANIKKDYLLFKKSLIEERKKIEKYKKSNPLKHQFDYINLILKTKDFRNHDNNLFLKFSTKSVNDYEM